MNILIEKAAVYVLDSLADAPLAATDILPLTDETEQYLAAFAAKGFVSDEARPCILQRDACILPILDTIESAFLQSCERLADKWFAIMKDSPSIPAGDLVCLLLRIEGTPHFAAMKLNHKPGYLYLYENAGGRLSRCENMLPATGKPDEALYVELSREHATTVLEKKYDIDGKKTAYLAREFAGCKSGLSNKEKLEVICEAAVEVNRQFYGSLGVDEPEVAAAVCEEFKNATGGVAAKEVCRRLYKDLPHAEEAFEKALAEHDLPFAEAVAISAPAVRRLEKQSLRSGSGVEIKVPVSVYRDKEAVEFLKNDDGTTSLLIKNILL